ncbi:tetraacyldisaccharide 4'-kinase [Thaumasiovibrio subtropicus]|uniref:tetraacyldisaccharide 4'-kinase n=1 Tax=Thaumasiovibrio subtropicus TaxID=1891207 RepID=UPI000B3615D9|nr:tetraacyldisaccharide 4'-kinase [Thaumasiovibrio subtropicus]
MIETLWFQPRWYHRLLWPLLWPLSRVYRSISRKRKLEFETAKRVSYRPSVPVIVVGNITAGGNGKTPVVVWLVEWLKQQGYRPGVVSRGYGAKAPHYPYVVKKDSPAEHAGDEPLLIRQRTRVPVVIAPRRARAVAELEKQGVNIVVTDDGLQHYALQRDIEVIVIDGQRRFGNEEFIPLGPLREGLERLKTADLLITNGGEPQENECAMRLKPSRFVNVKTGKKVEASHFEHAVAIAGIGHPPRFFDTLTDLGIALEKTVGFADHQAYDAETLNNLTPSQQPLLMTEKDAVKCRHFSQPHWWYLPVDAEMDSRVAETLRVALDKVKEKYGSPTA